jgi:very-short-patch-repair endonuclease
MAEWPAPVDFWLYTYLIIVQLDGEQHLYKDMHGTAARAQVHARVHAAP